MAATEDAGGRDTGITRESLCSIVICNDASLRSQPVIYNPDFFVEKLRHENPEVFTELVVSNITRLIDLPGTEFAQLMGEVDPKLPGPNGAAANFFKSLNFLKRKEKGIVFGAPLTEEGIAQIYQLIEYLHKNLMLFDDKGNRMGVPDKERQIEALQLLFLLLPSPNRNLLKLLLDLLYQTAKKQDRNKMSAHNLALMFAPHIVWPKNVTANDLQEHIIKLTNGVTFMIKHSQKLFKAPAYIREYARLYFSGSKTPSSKDDLELLSSESHKEFPFVKSQKRSRLGSSPSSSTSQQELTQRRTEEALRELFQHVHNMPDSAKKKKLIRQFNKHNQGTPDLTSGKKHVRSRSFSGMIKRKVLGGQAVSEKKRTETPLSSQRSEYIKENVKYVSQESPAVYFTKAKLKLSEHAHSKKEAPSKIKRAHLLSTQETSI
ncbi:rho GTPase-activating protein 19 isoform X2 [Hyla sarda]|uniref:rho GTPase-activating protein 19 isoform X2 n=1 Tax=Hyla sarda TaxID=327740 RepID=UPI0024C30DF8|nr:rho GTPase-activating protein 19 isoform X2 [Hyla sarda]